MTSGTDELEKQYKQGKKIRKKKVKNSCVAQHRVRQREVPVSSDKGFAILTPQTPFEILTKNMKKNKITQVI